MGDNPRKNQYGWEEASENLSLSGCVIFKSHLLSDLLFCHMNIEKPK